MIEIAIASMQEALAANGEAAPEGSLDPEREPVPDVHALAADVEARDQATGATATTTATGATATTTAAGVTAAATAAPAAPIIGAPAAEEPTGDLR